MTRLERIDELCRLRSSLEDIVVPNYSNPIDINRFVRQMRRYRDALSEVIDREVNNEYTVNPYRWIPVTERLPEVFKQVLICLNDGRMFTGYLAERDRMEWEDDEWERDYNLEEAAAWMELPGPYKEEE